MKKQSKNFYITTPIYYVNDVPHIGHAYTTVICDTIANFNNWLGKSVNFLTGTDEHGQKVEKSALKAGIDPQSFTNEVSKSFHNLVEKLEINNTDFIRTTEKRHKESVVELWKKLEKKGDIYLGKYSGWYSIRDEAFYSEDEIEQDKNGNKIAPNGSEVEWLEEPSYFFRLSAWQDKLLKFYKDNPEFISPKSRYNEVLSFVRKGLEDLSISRTTFRWGIPVPNNDDHIIYVWLDALTNYISALNYPNKNDENWKTFWPADIHVVGKDILRFHAVYWPAFLMAADIETPIKIYAHGWWTVDGKKMSKSTGNVVSPDYIINKYGLDQFKYFLLREVRFGQDGDFSENALVKRVNADLANDYGNLAQRVLSFIYKNNEALIPNKGTLSKVDKDLLNDMAIITDNIINYMKDYKITDALEELWIIIRKSNTYIDEQAPWALKKTDLDRMNTVLYVLCSIIKNVSLIAQNFIPIGANKILDQLLIHKNDREYNNIDDELISGTKISKPEGVFPRLEIKE
ncbi:MAG: Methionine--tRNA ligase [Alphaproteobacteria bacterium MarineAlpha9_Bin3]|nr:MAG: Methionine--tRNA ligase [Alphaproteobacteria bacterium MarineAlpha9_Bin3]|tara:strand:- start:4733 stop:6277 length:1545 start_codon:yes stop_codon:yes gene_type:complete